MATYLSRSCSSSPASSVAAGPRSDVGEDASIGAAGDRNAVECFGMADELGARPVHRAEAGGAGEDEGAVDVEKNEFLQRHGERYNPRQEAI